jgi:hypothetical protein
MFTPDATAAAIVGIFVLGCATSPWLQAACLMGSMARTIVPSRSIYAVADGPEEPARLAWVRSCRAVALALAVWWRQARIAGFLRHAAPRVGQP